jgi:hypothetical protein
VCKNLKKLRRQRVKERCMFRIHQLKSICIMEQTNKCTSIIYIIYLSVFQWSTGYWFPVDIVFGLLHYQMLNSTALHPCQPPFSTLLWAVLVIAFFQVTMSLFTFRPTVILHTYHLSTPFQRVVFQSFQNNLCYPNFF